MPMYNCLNTAQITEKKTSSLWNYYIDESSNHLSSNSESFRLIMLVKELRCRR